MSIPAHIGVNWIFFLIAIVPLDSSSVTIKNQKVKGVASVSFLITVNVTSQDSIDKGCMATTRTPFLYPGQHSKTEIKVGECDHGPLEFNIVSHKGGKDAMTVNLTFHSSVIEDASPPSCNIGWNGSYILPTSQKLSKSPLPGCFTSDSREGFHLTYYWFSLLDWNYG